MWSDRLPCGSAGFSSAAVPEEAAESGPPSPPSPPVDGAPAPLLRNPPPRPAQPSMRFVSCEWNPRPITGPASGAPQPGKLAARRIPICFPDFSIEMLKLPPEQLKQIEETGWLREVAFRTTPNVTKVRRSGPEVLGRPHQSAVSCSDNSSGGFRPHSPEMPVLEPVVTRARASGACIRAAVPLPHGLPSARGAPHRRSWRSRRSSRACTACR
jgi:hypothetical protein